MQMTFSSVQNTIRVLAVALAVSTALAMVCHAQAANPNQGNQPQPNPDQGKSTQQPAPKVDPKEEAAYKAFFDAPPQDSDKKIQLGLDFAQNYPNSRYIESVYSGLAQAYYAKQDWNNLYLYSDKALAINPNDVDILTLDGWVIPHVTDAKTPDAEKQLDKAETYEKRAIEQIPALPKPPGMTDEQFTTAKAEKTAEAHSGLGLVYFRRQDFDDAAKELQQATQENPNPDATDFYALGASLQNSGHFTEAADAYTRCGQIMGSLQDACKQNADKAKQLAAQKK
ncbi:MAG TPA: tetratricopeptide repeat protein [Candidatus Baltobacteraceae bacterium]|jgi:tetratricopeptide (TPR) repeat protein|nr:tetratricopeptide repeat protein [Candidatus Baltobacteraceae bacterium]